MTRTRLVWLLAAFGPMLGLVSCVSDGGKSASAKATSIGGLLTYSCSDGGQLAIQRLSNGVRLAGADAVEVDLPAAPAGQDSRYSQEPYTLVLDGQDALFVKTGDEPRDCTR